MDPMQYKEKFFKNSDRITYSHSEISTKQIYIYSEAYQSQVSDILFQEVLSQRTMS